MFNTSFLICELINKPTTFYFLSSLLWSLELWATDVTSCVWWSSDFSQPASDNFCLQHLQVFWTETVLRCCFSACFRRLVKVTSRPGWMIDGCLSCEGLQLLSESTDTHAGPDMWFMLKSPRRLFSLLLHITADWDKHFLFFFSFLYFCVFKNITAPVSFMLQDFLHNHSVFWP